MYMYRYDEIDRILLEQRIEQFRDQVHRRLSGELTEDQFKHHRLKNGLYLQLHAYMLRVAVPYGVLSSPHMRMLAHIARTYDRGYGHFTTRQNIQFNWVKLEDAPDILADLAKVDMHAIQTSGNCIRNVTSDQFAGVAADEIEDPRLYCEVIRQWSTFHPEFSFLPRKFKIAVTGAPNDRAAVRVHDIGLRMVRNEQGEAGFEVLVGGGLGRTPVIAKVIRTFLPKRHLLSYLEAILRVYNLAGRRDNIYKARIKILVDAMGADAFREAVEAEWTAMEQDRVDLTEDDLAAAAARFPEPPYESLAPYAPAFEDAKRESEVFARWTRTALHPHKRPGYVAVTASLKPVGGIPGDASADQMDAIADLADRFSFGMVRVTHHQNLVFADVRLDDVPALWRELDALGLATSNIGLVSDIIACPGLDYCALANARSIPVAQRIAERFADLDHQYDIGALSLNISGCINACGHHHVGHIGILGVDKKGVEFYQITLGGSSGDDASLGQLLGASLSADDAVDAVETVVTTYLSIRKEGERFLDTVRRTGLAPFKEAVYAPR